MVPPKPTAFTVELVNVIGWSPTIETEPVPPRYSGLLKVEAVLVISVPVFREMNPLPRRCSPRCWRYCYLSEPLLNAICGTLTLASEPVNVMVTLDVFAPAATTVVPGPSGNVAVLATLFELSVLLLNVIGAMLVFARVPMNVMTTLELVEPAVTSVVPEPSGDAAAFKAF